MRAQNIFTTTHWVAYIITLKGKPYFVHLKKQSFLSSASVVYSYDKRGIQHSQTLLPQMDCSYSGYVTGFPHSLVALMTCSGLRGVMQFKNVSYKIEPLEAVSGFMHLIYEENNDNTHVPLFGENDSFAQLNDVDSEVRSSIHKTKFAKLFPRYIEICIIVDKNLFDYMGSDIKTVTQKVIQLMGLVNSMFAQLKLTILISSIEIWSKTNKITTTGHPDDVLFRFLAWKHQHVGLKHHISYLLVFEKHPTFIGATFPRYICDKNYASGVALYPAGLSLESYAVIIVQLLGLNMGLVYDNTDTCYCSADVCTMTPKAVYSGGLKDFSTCSLDSFKSFATHYGLSCLKNNPHEVPVYKQTKPKRICGNSIREEGEECDCGTLQNCTHKKCCDPTTCRKKKGAKCGSGACCTTDCQIKKANVLCRPSVDADCDFDEYCNGQQGDCVPDTYAHDGHSCDSGGAFCFSGTCRTHDKQCQELLGGDSRGASFACFDEINSEGDRYGNCGKFQCNIRNALCGKLVCMWPHKELVSRVNLSVIYTHVRDEICVTTSKTVRKVVRTASLSTYLHPEDRDETFVQDGTICGPEQYCDKWHCKEVRFVLNTSCRSSLHCSSKGICNNFHNCHCEKGYSPPECEKKKGAFGSVDDGHVPITEKSDLRAEYAAPLKHNIQLIFYISIPVLIIAAAILIKQNKLRELYCRGEKEHESSMSEDRSMNVTLSSTESKSPANKESNAEAKDVQKPSEVAYLKKETNNFSTTSVTSH
ncbi:PREDICTED: disintegrin and metalloproteinase domain-containing protein 5-like isoform X2 [Chinchilla lanigera]|uniref:disintegrin and metalloproteinase domain-containing protein 5-like isoform X2 n=1 Tax=Chinchilla lanigera TaxID=34839 RepID=UPI00038ED88D|nr:PREDICTED: disintegrin and metalloproteinase domain-containing protein 5-like isoform X2 [Chinchilla lanigera]